MATQTRTIKPSITGYIKKANVIGFHGKWIKCLNPDGTFSYQLKR